MSICQTSIIEISQMNLECKLLHNFQGLVNKGDRYFPVFAGTYNEQPLSLSYKASETRKLK